MFSNSTRTAREVLQQELEMSRAEVRGYKSEIERLWNLVDEKNDHIDKLLDEMVTRKAA